jgi:hypothetical protein
MLAQRGLTALGAEKRHRFVTRRISQHRTWCADVVRSVEDSMPLQALARRTDEAKRALELARTKLELTAAHWADRRAPRALNELQRRAEQFAAAQRELEEALREWARALQSKRTVMELAAADGQ